MQRELSDAEKESVIQQLQQQRLLQFTVSQAIPLFSFN